jgi:hypothetical protein
VVAIALTVALIAGAMIDGGIMTAQKPLSNAAVVSIGFLVGYLADDIVGKMCEIAGALFGTGAMSKNGAKSGDGK